VTATATATGDAKSTSTIRRHEGVECDGEQLERAEKDNCLAARPATERFSAGVDNAQRRDARGDAGGSDEETEQKVNTERELLTQREREAGAEETQELHFASSLPPR